MMKGEGKATIVSVHNILAEILPYMSMHMMMYLIATIVDATFTVDDVVDVDAGGSAGVMHIT
jgi:hypothetical protein